MTEDLLQALVRSQKEIRQLSSELECAREMMRFLKPAVAELCGVLGLTPGEHHHVLDLVERCTEEAKRWRIHRLMDRHCPQCDKVAEHQTLDQSVCDICFGDNQRRSNPGLCGP